MRTKTGPNGSADKHVKEIKRKTRRQFSAEEKVRQASKYRNLYCFVVFRAIVGFVGTIETGRRQAHLKRF